MNLIFIFHLENNNLCLERGWRLEGSIIKIIEYGIVTNDEPDLSTMVNAHIKKGWQPFGGVSMIFNMGGGFFFAQAMVKYEKHDEAKE